MSQDEALAFTLALSLLTLIVSGMSQAMVISCCHFHSQTVFASEHAAPPTVCKDVGVWCCLYQPLAP